MFKPKFTITPMIAQALMKIEGVKQAIKDLPINSKVQGQLRETARLLSTHYSTQIEGNKLTLNEATRLIQKDEHFPGRQHDEAEVLGYYRALDELERLSKVKTKITQTIIQKLHSMVMGGKKGRIKPTPYRNGQNVIRDSRNGKIVYLPPESKDVPKLMADLVIWIGESDKQNLPFPIRAAIAHYQLATIHPYYDGNGRTARLLATLTLYLGGYDLKSFYSLEEYYAHNLPAYYKALSLGPSHNYYIGRAEADITTWIEYFCIGMADSFVSVESRAQEAAKLGQKDQSVILRQLDSRQRKVLDLFKDSDWITSSQVAKLFGLQPRTARDLCQKWTVEKFLKISDPSKKARKYELSRRWSNLA